nr:ABC transporter substrate-binding protein [Aquabacterium terrae]
MTALGWTEGVSLRTEHRFGRGDATRIGEQAASLEASGVDVLLAWGSPAARAAVRNTRSVPIVFNIQVDPVELGIVESLNRPGGRVTGVTGLTKEEAGKRLSLLKDALPGLHRVGMLFHPPAVMQGETDESERAAALLGLQLIRLELHGLDDWPATFGLARRSAVQALTVLAAPSISRNQERIAKLCLQHRLPAIYWRVSFPQLGGFLSYGGDPSAATQRLAAIVSSVLGGKSPESIPVERPSRFRLAVNRRTARELGLTLPSNFLTQVDESIDR